MTQRKIQYWVIPLKENGQFVANKENVLVIYKCPHDEGYPVVCTDEQPVQLLEEVTIPIAVIRKHARQAVYEYKRSGLVSIFMFCEPLAGGVWSRFGSVARKKTGPTRSAVW